MKRRKTVSVTPAMGASTVAGAIVTFPITNLCGETHTSSLAFATPAGVSLPDTATR